MPPETPGSDPKIWIDAISALANAIIAIVAVFGGAIRKWWYKPILNINIANSNSQGLPTTDGDGKEVVYYLLRVENKPGKDRATNCEVVVEKFERQNPTGGYDVIELPARISLAWSPLYRYPGTRDIKDLAYLDFFKISNNGGYFCMHSNQWNNYVITKDMKVRIGLRVISDNFISPKLQLFVIKWDGSYQHNAFAMTKHVEIIRLEDNVSG